MTIFDFGRKKNRAEDNLGLGEKLTNRTETDTGFSLKGTFDSSKMKRYQMAMEKKAILFDKEDKDGIDYTHFDFVLSTGCGFYNGMSNLESLKLFWKAFYPYLKTITDSYEKFYEQFRNIIDDQEDVLAKHAEVVFENKWTEKYLESIGKKEEHGAFLSHKKAQAIQAQQEALKTQKRAVDNLPDLKEKGNEEQPNA